MLNLTARRAGSLFILLFSIFLVSCLADLGDMGGALQTAVPDLGLPTLASPQEVLETLGAPDLLATLGAPDALSTLVPGYTPRPRVTPLGGEQAQACIPANTERTEAVLSRVIDGDTIDVEIGGEIFRVRYIGVDTPERGEPLYREAAEMNASLLGQGRLVLLRDVSETDRFDRLLRYVLADGLFVNYELAVQGYAESVTFPPDVSCEETFRAAVQQARAARRGLWGD